MLAACIAEQSLSAGEELVACEPQLATRGRPGHMGQGMILENIDTSFVPDSDSDNILVGPRPARAIAEHAAQEFTQRFIAGAECFLLSHKQRRALGAIIGMGGMPEKMLASCIPTRLQLTAQLTEQWRADWQLHRGKPGRQYIFVTIVTDSGNTLARESTIDLEALRRRVDKVQRPANLQGNFVLEVQAIINFPRHGHGATHCWHEHGIMTIDDPAFDLKELENALRESGRLSNIFDAPTVTIKRIASLADLMRCVAYMLKAPSVGKFLTEHPFIPQAWTLEKTFVRKDVALRLGEALSQVELGQVVHSVGDGKYLLRRAMKAVRAWHKTQYAQARNKLSKDADLAKLWAEMRASRSNNRYSPYFFGPVHEEAQSGNWTSIAIAALDALGARPSSRHGGHLRAKRTSSA